MLTKGTNFQIFDGSDFVLIDQIVSLSLGQNTWTTVETTPIHTTSRGRSYKATLNDVGDITFTVQHVADDPGQAELAAAHQSGESVQFKVTHPELGSFTLSAIVTGFKPVMEVDQLFGFDCTLKVNGVIGDEAPTIMTVNFGDAFGGEYETGNVIQVKVHYDEVVKVTGTPRIPLVFGIGSGFANYSAGTGTNVLTFTHTVLIDDVANTNEFSVTSPIALNGGTIKDHLGADNADLTFTPPNTAAFTVNPGD